MMSHQFIPKRAFFEPKALEYPIGQKVYEQLQEMKVPIILTGSHNRITGIPGDTPQEAYQEAKNTLVVGIRKSLDFAGCKPSAHYQLPLTTSCSSMCEYCYLATTLGKKPYLRVYVNVNEVLGQASRYIRARAPEITWFEGAATSDPIPTEYLTGLLYNTIEFFGRQPFGRFRFVTKHDRVDSLLTAKHNGHTRFRFSINAASIIDQYEHKTPTLIQRVEAAAKVAEKGYPVGFIIAPIFYYPGWEEAYLQLLQELDKQLPKKDRSDITFELIAHRFTKRAKNNILEIFPETKLPMKEEERKFKYGQFGYGKYVYQKETMDEMKNDMHKGIHTYFPHAAIEYFV
jgi:spore photoproduct lyase